MRGAGDRGARWWITRHAVVLVGVLACQRGASRVEPPTKPVGEATPAARTEATPGPAPAQPPIDEGWAPPVALLEPARELRVDWERPPPTGVPAAERRPSPSQLQWEHLVSFGPTLPVPLDDASRPCRRQHFLSHDARPLRTVELRHDAAGRLVSERTDEDTDGTIDFESHWTWGADGRLEHDRQRTAPQPSCSGMLPQFVAEHRHRYDAHGVWLGGQASYDGSPEVKTAWRTTQYDEAGRLVLYLVHPTHEPQTAITLRWSDAGELLERVDSVGPSPRRVERSHRAADGSRYRATWDGTVWSVARTVVDADGRARFEQRDVDGDGDVDERIGWRYDAQGRRVEETRDADGDGDVDERTTFDHDAAGYLVGRVNEGREGTLREAWQYDAAHRVLRWTSKRDESWVEDVEEHVYDGHGRELERRIDRHHAVGSPGDLKSYVTRERWRGERDEKGRLLRAFVAEGELGPNERIEYVYDCAKPYRRFPRRNPLDHPERAAECLGGE